MEEIDYKDFEVTLFSDDSKSLIAEAAEYGLDAWLDRLEGVSSITKDIPIIRTVTGLVSVGQALRERHLMKQTFTFFKAFYSNDIAPDSLQKLPRKAIRGNYISS